MPWTPYLEECCRILDSPGSPQQDKSAVMLARIQMVAQRLGQNPWEGRQDFTGNAPPPLLYFKSLEKQIQKLREQMDPVIKDQSKFLLYLSTCCDIDLILQQSSPGLSRPQKFWQPRSACLRLQPYQASPIAISIAFNIYVLA